MLFQIEKEKIKQTCLAIGLVLDTTSNTSHTRRQLDKPSLDPHRVHLSPCEFHHRGPKKFNPDHIIFNYVIEKLTVIERAI